MIRKFACFYEVLGVGQKAMKNEIKAAYYNLAKTHHPDLAGSSDTFKHVKEAYEILIDDEKRYKYDLDKGYLNALDIDEMEENIRKYGSRYPSSDLLSNLRSLDQSLHEKFFENQAQTKISKPNSPVFDDLFYLRIKFLLSLFGGFTLTYNTSLFILESYIYPSSPDKSFNNNSKNK